MSVISYTDLVRLCKCGLCSAPVAQVNGASIDVTLGAKLLVEQAPAPRTIHELVDYATKMPWHKPISLRDREPLPVDEYTMGADGFVLQPGQFVLAQTQETFNLPNTIAGNFQLKSTAARMGLTNLLAGWADPGWHGSVLTLELHNATRYTPIRLRAGDRIGQMIFQRVQAVPEFASYKTLGHYNNDREVSGAKKG